MSINSTIRAAVTPIVAVCVPDVYTGTATEYCTFNVSKYPARFADDKPTHIGNSVQLHYFCPTGVNPDAKITALTNALFAEGFSYPEAQDMSDKDGQHFVLECEFIDAVN